VGAGLGVGAGVGGGDGVGFGGFGVGFGFEPGRGFGAGLPEGPPVAAGPRATREVESAFVPDAPRRRVAGLGITAGGSSAAWAGVIRLGATGLPEDSGPVSNAARQR
jgi:hypothetical protein